MPSGPPLLVGDCINLPDWKVPTNSNGMEVECQKTREGPEKSERLDSSPLFINVMLEQLYELYFSVLIYLEPNSWIGRSTSSNNSITFIYDFFGQSPFLDGSAICIEKFLNCFNSLLCHFSLASILYYAIFFTRLNHICCQGCQTIKGTCLKWMCLHIVQNRIQDPPMTPLCLVGFVIVNLLLHPTNSIRKTLLF